MTCPKCHLENPSSALRCDCGFNFDKGVVESDQALPKGDNEQHRTKRSIGITISAILVFIGSLLWLLISLLVLVSLSQPTNIPNATLGVAFAFALALCSVVGLLTAIALFRRKRWARISLLIFASVLAYVGGASLVIWLIFPPPTFEQVSAGRIGVILFFSLIMSVGLWWLYFLNKASVKAQFPMPAKISKRPASITVISVSLFFSAIGAVLFAVLGWPNVFFGLVLSGWAALAMNVVLGVFSLYVGLGLFRLKELSRKLAIGYVVYMMINFLPFLLPGFEARVATLFERFPPDIVGKSTTAMSTGALWFSYFQGLMMFAIALWLLVTRKKAFTTPTGRYS